jgi:hypothetical protein
MELIREDPCMGTWVKGSAQEYKILFWWREPYAFIIDESGQEEDSFSLGVLWKPRGKHIESCTRHTTGLQQKI